MRISRKTIIVFAAFLVVLVVIGLVKRYRGESAAQASASITNWGLSFQKEGQCPVGNASEADLEEYGARFVGDTSSKTIYLTFDAGYENGHTAAILDTLKEKSVKASFFLVGNFIESEPELVKRMHDEGHLVGNHTYSHPDMSTILTDEAFASELRKNEELYREITGAEMDKYYRPPQGKYCTDNLIMAKELGYNTVFWSLAYVDWYVDDQPSKEEAFDKLVPRIHDGAIILLHSTSATNTEILGELIDRYRDMGYTFGNLEDLY